MTLTQLIPVVTATLLSPLVGASDRPAASDHSGHSQHAFVSADNAPGLVEKVRQAIQPFRDVEQARAAGYAEFLGCVSGPEEGAMGVHFVNSAFVGDGELDVNHPEAIIYEPRNDGFHLVGVEYIVLADAWNANHPTAPVLEGQVFQFNDSPNRFRLPAFYELHVWAARDNPRGAFADWNPRVSCEGE